jgi:LytS/YehU family sensor histidine kinase
MRAEHLKTEAELNALRAQLNPHFLFNTLHSLMALVRTDSAAAENAIERLAALLRYSLKAKHNGGNDDVSLSTEWKFVQNYLALERLRLGERLKVEADLPAATFNSLLPARYQTRRRPESFRGASEHLRENRKRLSEARNSGRRSGRFA